jgi:hypothetical protein
MDRLFSLRALISFRHCLRALALTTMKFAIQSLALASAMVLSACGGRGTSAPPPTGLTATGQDTQITLNWNVQSGVEYRVYCAPGSNVDNGISASGANATTPNNWYTTPGGVARVSTGLDLVLPPFTVDRLQNDTDYACTVDARVSGGPAGVSAPAVTARTRWVGDFRKSGDGWQALASNGMASTGAVASGILTGQTVTRLYAAGSAGRVRVSDDVVAGTWSDLTGLPSGLGDLTSAMVFVGKLVVAGTTGVVASSQDLSNWNSASLGSPVKSFGSSGTRLVAVGPSGLIRYSTDGTNWNTPTLLPADLATHDLNSVAYSAAGYWVAVGSGGTVLVSTTSDASQWTYATGSRQTGDIHVVAVLPVQDPATLVTTYKAVAAGANGAVGYSTDLNNWTWQSLGNQTFTQLVAGSQTFYKLASSTSIIPYTDGQFLLAGRGGVMYRSGDGLLWDGASWSNISTSLGSSADPTVLFHFSNLNTLGTTTSWLLYNVDGTARWVR